MMQETVLKAVQKGMQFVPGPVRSAMKSNSALAECVVIGTAFTAYGTGKVTGSQAIAGSAIGITTLAVRKIPVDKIFSAGIGLLKRK